MDKKILILFTFILFLFPIYVIYCNYHPKHYYLSNILCNHKVKHYFINFLFLFSILILLYEYIRNDFYSIFIICVILIATYMLICINEQNLVHWGFAFLVLLFMLFFMIRHCYTEYCDSILLSSLLLEIIIALLIIFFISDKIFWLQSFFILNFGFFYIYLEFIQ
jgi:hypothetical protein